LACEDGAALITNCTVTGNVATGGGDYSGGGGIRCYGEIRSSLMNSILYGNSGLHGPEILVSGSSTWGYSTLNVAYCDVAGGEAAAFVRPGSTLLWGAGNLDADPLFVDPDGPDGDPDTWEDNDLHLAAGSPCIDAGCNCGVASDRADLDHDGDIDEYTPFDLDGEGRFFDDLDTPDSGSGLPPIVDMGAYEFGDSDTSPCRGDLDGDRDVDVADLAILLANYRTMSGATGADGDMDCDGDVELSDLAALLSAYGAVCD
jgi:hypothetical protein